MTLNPPEQYANDRNFRARQRLWQYQRPPFDIVAWVLDLARLSPGMLVLDAGCGNGAYLRGLRDRRVRAVGCDLSAGMLRAAADAFRRSPAAADPAPASAAPAGAALVSADVAALPARDGAFDVVLAVHMLYHVPDRAAAVRELRRVLAPGGTCIAVTNGAQHLRSLRALVELAVRKETPGWQLHAPATRVFAAENAPAQLGAAFGSVTCIRPPGAGLVFLRDAAVAADYVASMASHYQDQTARPWPDVAQDVRQRVQAVIDSQGVFTTSGDLAAFVCQ